VVAILWFGSGSAQPTTSAITEGTRKDLRVQTSIDCGDFRSGLCMKRLPRRDGSCHILRVFYLALPSVLGLM
jgi:hypothetical protein